MDCVVFVILLWTTNEAPGLFLPETPSFNEMEAFGTGAQGLEGSALEEQIVEGLWTWCGKVPLGRATPFCQHRKSGPNCLLLFCSCSMSKEACIPHYPVGWGTFVWGLMLPDQTGNHQVSRTVSRQSLQLKVLHHAGVLCFNLHWRSRSSACPHMPHARRKHLVKYYSLCESVVRILWTT